jgi:Fe-S cluster assembly protein SufD
LSENASVRHIKIINENIRSYHYGQLRVDQERDSRFQSLAFLFGNKLNRNNISIILNGSGCESLMDGVFAGHRNQHHDVHTLIHHASPHCRSHELYRGILADESSAVFSGKIHVHPDAQKTDALQSNNCLLLSDQATINTKPQLEIYADDVKCTHGATVGQLNEDQIYYLRSRGIPEKKARNILTYAFAREIIEQVETEEVRNYIDQLLLNRLEEDMDFHK